MPRGYLNGLIAMLDLEQVYSNILRKIQVYGDEARWNRGGRIGEAKTEGSGGFKEQGKSQQGRGDVVGERESLKYACR